MERGIDLISELPRELMGCLWVCFIVLREEESIWEREEKRCMGDVLGLG